ncbi:unnamed protein product [Gordionus sp. m RMFG-2023]
MDIMEQGPDDPLVYASKDLIDKSRTTTKQPSSRPISPPFVRKLSQRSHTHLPSSDFLTNNATAHNISKWFKKEKSHFFNPNNPLGHYTHHNKEDDTDSEMTESKKYDLSNFDLYPHESSTNKEYLLEGLSEEKSDKHHKGPPAFVQKMFKKFHSDGKKIDTLPPPNNEVFKESAPDESYNENGRLNDDVGENNDLAKDLNIYHLNIHIENGENLAIKDICGSSDPYVKIKLGSVTVYRTKTIKANLNPVWNENVIIPIEKLEEAKVKLFVYDYDRTTQDDFMGAAALDCSNLPLEDVHQLRLKLVDPDKPDIMGYINVNVSLTKQILDEKDSRIISLRRAAQKKMINLIWTSTVTLIVLEGKDIKPANPGANEKDQIEEKHVSKLDQPLNLYLKIRLGPEKAKTKVIYKSENPHWRERFNFHLYMNECQIMNINLYQKTQNKPNLLLGNFDIDLSTIPLDVSTTFWKNLENGYYTGSIKFMVVITGCQVRDEKSETIQYTESCDVKSLYSESLLKTFSNMQHVGYLVVKVLKARNLSGVDIGGTSDPFCILELINTRLQTQTIYKTISPEWNKTFVFEIHDVFTSLDVSVFDENKNSKMKFLGKLIIPLLSIQNNIPNWYKLKNQTLKNEIKGEIQLEMVITYNIVKACIQSFQPKEEKIIFTPTTFNKSIFIDNVNRTKALIKEVMAMKENMPSIFNWENPKISLISFLAFILLVYYFHPCMIPILIGALFVKGYMDKKRGFDIRYEPTVQEEDDNEIESQSTKLEKEKDPKTGIKSTIQIIQETCQTIQNTLDSLASYGERVKNIFNFSLPLLSYIAIILLVIGFFLLYFIPIRWLILAWGINKFSKKLRSPLSLDNNELFDFISRFPSDKEKLELKEFYYPPSDHVVNHSSSLSSDTPFINQFKFAWSKSIKRIHGMSFKIKKDPKILPSSPSH